MDSMFNTLPEGKRAREEEKKRPISNGFFNVSCSNRKYTFKLKGDFNNENINVINKVMSMSTSSNMKFIKLDMRAMARLSILLKILKDNGTYTKITGLEGEVRKLAYELGMHYITEII